ncbi:MAG: hypothetical protein BalsKO_29160 [Balneolaceae bacterium]
MKPISFSTYLESSSKLGYTFIVVPPDIVKSAGGFGVRLLCSIKGNEKIHSGLLSKGDGNGYIIINKKRQKKWGISLNDELEATIELDTSKYGMEISEELEVLLEQDRVGATLFEKLTPGQKRYIIHYVGSVKSSQKKIDRAILLIENLKTMTGKFDFRYLLGVPPREE